jgi:starch synthase
VRILFAASEAAPLVKVGGLGDVAGSLPRALRALGHDVRVVIPGYGAIDWKGIRPARRASIPVPYRNGQQVAEIWQTEASGVPVYLVTGPPIPRDSRVYAASIEEEAREFVFFALSALWSTRELDWRPDVFHANDWHAGAAVYWLASSGRSDRFFESIASVFTIHNLPYSGLGSRPALVEYGLDSAAGASAVPAWARDSPLALALAAADMLSTVSPTYAREILTPVYGEGLDALLRTREMSLVGILNGIDTEAWNPSTDAALPSRYDPDSLERRRENRAALRSETGLDSSDAAPLLGAVARLDRQKGFEIATEPVRGWLSQGGQFVLLGTGDPAIERRMEALAQAFPGRARAVLRFDPALARRIYGGSDALLIPSRYEPCGLTQMIGMRYGTVPIARKTGGLADTIRDAAEPDGNGILFDDFAPEALWGALNRALSVYSQPARWTEIQRRGMTSDFSWDRSALRYVELYGTAAALRRGVDPTGAGVTG